MEVRKKAVVFVVASGVYCVALWAVYSRWFVGRGAALAAMVATLSAAAGALLALVALSLWRKAHV